MSTAACRSRRSLLALASSACLSSCFPSGPDFSDPRRVTGVRVLAVTPDPASGSPGARVALRMEVVDAAQFPREQTGDGGADGSPALSVAWLGGCHNPPSDQHYGCYPLLQQIAARLPSPLPTSAAEVPESERLAWGLGTRFAVEVPSDILEGRELSTDALPFGVSFAFFAACRGQLVPAPELGDGVPLRCVSERGESAGSEGFVRGFATVYTYAAGINRPPVVLGRSIDGIDAIERACNTDADCADLAQGPLDAACARPVSTRIAGEEPASERRCLPRVASCAAPPCRNYALMPRLDVTSIEPDPSAAPPGGPAPNEVIWVKYYSIGAVSEDEVLVNDRASGLNPNYAVRFRPPPRPSEAPVPVWAVVQDSRGGASVSRWDFVVTE